MTTLLQTILLVTALLSFAGCSSSGSATTNESENAVSNQTGDGKFTLPSGRMIRVTSVSGMNFENGDTGLLLNYQTSIPIENMEELKKEVDEIWDVFRVDVEKANVTSGIIRATYITEDGLIVKKGNGYGFVYKKESDGTWQRIKKEK